MKLTLRMLGVGVGLLLAGAAFGQGVMSVPTAGTAPVMAADSPAMSTLCSPACPAASTKLGGQIFFRFGAAFSNDDRSGQVFTDTAGARGVTNDGKTGVAVGFGFHMPLMKDPILGNSVLGEVLMDYAQFSNKRVVVATSALLGNPQFDNVRVNHLAVVGSPKYRFDGLGDFRPWVVPVGLGFYVNSPPTNNATYLDVGLQYGAGLDYKLTDNLSVGVDCRYHMYLTRDGGWLTTGAYLGFNF